MKKKNCAAHVVRHGAVLNLEKPCIYNSFMGGLVISPPPWTQKPMHPSSIIYYRQLCTWYPPTKFGSDCYDMFRP